MRIGAHMSSAGGVSLAVDRAALHGCEALQIFSRNPSRWQSPAIGADEARRFQRRVDETGLHPVVAHASYLINLAAANPRLRAQSIAAMADEIARAHQLGLLGVVLHPGTCTSGTTPDGLRAVADGIRDVFALERRWATMVLLEHTAGQGRTLGWRFEDLAAILGHLDGHARVGVCLDTCHLLASGYDIASAGGHRETFDAFERIVGFDRLKVVHANDSKRPAGSRVDRHAHIGDGFVGFEAFHRILHDPRFAAAPLIIETEKSAGAERPGAVVLDPLDEKNLGNLRRLRTI